MGRTTLLCASANKHRLEPESHYGKGNIYSFTLKKICQVSRSPESRPDGDRRPADRSAIVREGPRSSCPPRIRTVKTASRRPSWHVEQAVDE